MKGLWQADLKVKHVACRDIGKGARNAGESVQVEGKTLDCASDDVTGTDVAAALTAASGVECTYGVAVPRFVMRCVMKDLNAMIEFFETTGYDSDIAAFKAVVPDAQDCKAWFEARGVKSWSESSASSSWFWFFESWRRR